jgi:phenylacetate-coenzyme A ligase PaaK-like adenylate-forming protein
MSNVSAILEKAPFSIPTEHKRKLYLEILHQLTGHHYENCVEYKNILDVLNFKYDQCQNIEDIPPIPVRLFKEYELSSVDSSKIKKTMTSSGTSGLHVSKIYLDKETASRQTKALAKITSAFIGSKRLPMLIIDTKTVLKNRNLFSARGAGILGFSLHGYDVTYALDENMELDLQAIEAFYDKHQRSDIFIFGFTFMIWEYLYKPLMKNKISLNLKNGILIHGGGWKKLAAEEVNNETFKKQLHSVCGLERIHNYYGMVEQTGSIFMECEEGYLHSSAYSDVIMRRHSDFSVCDFGEKGLIELISVIPGSYPGHVILSEDVGEVIGVDDCKCGRYGTYFKVHGRIKKAEVRGCSDSYT